MTTSRREVRALEHKPGESLEVFEHGHWTPCVLIKIAGYTGKSGPGYYAAYDPPSARCASFWCHDGVLRPRHSA